MKIYYLSVPMILSLTWPALATESAWTWAYRPADLRFSDDESNGLGVCIMPQPINYYCGNAVDAAIDEINAPGIGIKWCGEQRVEINDENNPLRASEVQVRLADDALCKGDERHPRDTYYEYRPFTIEVEVTSTSSLLAPQQEHDWAAYHEANRLIAMGFYCALLATDPSTTNPIILRVKLPDGCPVALKRWEKLSKSPFYWNAKKATVQKGGIEGFKLFSDRGVWYCDTKE